MLILNLEDELIDKDKPCFLRVTARAVVLKERMALMVYCKYFDDYSFPGGGLEIGETLLECLHREAKEEGGVEVKVIKEIAIVNEYRHHELKQNYHKESHFYLCECINEEEAIFEDYELLHGYEKVWIDIDEAIVHNKKLLIKIEETRKDILARNNFEVNEIVLDSFKGLASPCMLKREIQVLEYLKKEHLDEKI
ncbi:MAG: NUDIX domain-containing protein [Erysipelotrichales bacterium]|nr:NUDIX domain-containing protein [Erysipelotrichales bacterium]